MGGGGGGGRLLSWGIKKGNRTKLTSKEEAVSQTERDEEEKFKQRAKLCMCIKPFAAIACTISDLKCSHRGLQTVQFPVIEENYI